MVAEIDTEQEIAKRIPENGAISQASIEFLVSHIPPERIATKIADMLEAKTPQGNPDWRAQSDGVKLYLSYVVGLPVQRQEIIQHRITSAPTMDRLLANPATVEALWRQLQATEAGRAMIAKLASEPAERVEDR